MRGKICDIRPKSSFISETVRDKPMIDMDHYYEVISGRPIRVGSSDLEWSRKARDQIVPTDLRNVGNGIFRGVNHAHHQRSQFWGSTLFMFTAVDVELQNSAWWHIWGGACFRGTATSFYILQMRRAICKLVRVSCFVHIMLYILDTFSDRMYLVGF